MGEGFHVLNSTFLAIETTTPIECYKLDFGTKDLVSNTSKLPCAAFKLSYSGKIFGSKLSYPGNPFDVESQHSDPLHYKETGVELVTLQKNFTIFLAMKGSKKYSLCVNGCCRSSSTQKLFFPFRQNQLMSDFRLKVL